MALLQRVAQAEVVVEGRGIGAIGQGLLVFVCAEPGDTEALAERIAESIRDVTKLRGSVAFHAPGSLANDGKVIDDIRQYR